MNPLPNSQGADSPRVVALDGVRGVAIGGVLADHFWPDETLGGCFPVGMLAVKLFFVLSGYLISGILLRGAARADRGGTSRRHVLATFYARRAVRIFPVYYLVMLAAAVLHLGDVRQSLAWHAAYASNFYVALVVGGWPTVTGHFWSLALEEQFYLVWPWLLVFTPATRRRAAVSGVIAATVAARIVAVAAGMGSHALDTLPIGSLDALALGALLAALTQGDAAGAAWRRRLDRIGLLVAAPVFLGLCVAQHFGAAEDVRRVLWPLCVALVFFAIVGGAADGAPRSVRGLLEWTPLVRLGRISYGLYIYHPFVKYGVLALLGASRITNAGTSLLCLAFSVAMAETSWRLIEAPLLQRRDRVRRAGDADAVAARPLAEGFARQSSS